MSLEALCVSVMATMSSYLKEQVGLSSPDQLTADDEGSVATPTMGNFLQIGTVVAGRLQAIERELGSDVFGSDVTATLSGTASFKQIGRQEFHVCAILAGLTAAIAVLQQEGGSSLAAAGFFPLAAKAERAIRTSDSRDDFIELPETHYSTYLSDCPVVRDYGVWDDGRRLLRF